MSYNRLTTNVIFLLMLCPDPASAQHWLDHPPCDGRDLQTMFYLGPLDPHAVGSDDIATSHGEVIDEILTTTSCFVSRGDPPIEELRIRVIPELELDVPSSAAAADLTAILESQTGARLLAEAIRRELGSRLLDNPNEFALGDRSPQYVGNLLDIVVATEIYLDTPLPQPDDPEDLIDYADDARSDRFAIVFRQHDGLAPFPEYLVALADWGRTLDGRGRVYLEQAEALHVATLSLVEEASAGGATEAEVEDEDTANERPELVFSVRGVLLHVAEANHMGADVTVGTFLEYEPKDLGWGLKTGARFGAFGSARDYYFGGGLAVPALFRLQGLFGAFLQVSALRLSLDATSGVLLPANAFLLEGEFGPSIGIGSFDLSFTGMLGGWFGAGDPYTAWSLAIGLSAWL